MDAYRLGEIFAVLDACLRGGLPPTELSLAETNPGARFAVVMRRATPYKYPDLDKLLSELLEDVSPDDMRTGPLGYPDQGRFQLGYYHRRTKLTDEGLRPFPGETTRRGRPAAGGGIDWSDVDWSMSNSEISRIKCCTPATVRARRQRSVGQTAKDGK